MRVVSFKPHCEHEIVKSAHVDEVGVLLVTPDLVYISIPHSLMEL